MGTQAFTPIQNNLGKKYVTLTILLNEFHNVLTFYRWTFIIAAICGVTGILVTYFFVPDMTGWSIFILGPTVVLIDTFLGVDLADEDRKFMQYLADNGWEGEIGEDEDLVDDDTSSESVSVDKK